MPKKPITMALPREPNPKAISAYGQTPLAGSVWRKSRINTIRAARQTAQLCVLLEMQPPEAEEAA